MTNAFEIQVEPLSANSIARSITSIAGHVLMSVPFGPWRSGDGISNVLRDHFDGVCQIVRIITFPMSRYRRVQRCQK
jgi:hypothetical protein